MCAGGAAGRTTMGCTNAKQKVAPVDAPRETNIVPSSAISPEVTEKRIVRVMTARKLADDTKRRQRRSKIA